MFLKIKISNPEELKNLIEKIGCELVFDNLDNYSNLLQSYEDEVASSMIRTNRQSFKTNIVFSEQNILRIIKSISKKDEKIILLIGLCNYLYDLKLPIENSYKELFEKYEKHLLGDDVSIFKKFEVLKNILKFDVIEYCLGIIKKFLIKPNNNPHNGLIYRGCLIETEITNLVASFVSMGEDYEPFKDVQITFNFPNKEILKMLEVEIDKRLIQNKNNIKNFLDSLKGKTYIDAEQSIYTFKDFRFEEKTNFIILNLNIKKNRNKSLEIFIYENELDFTEKGFFELVVEKTKKK